MKQESGFIPVGSKQKAAARRQKADAGYRMPDAGFLKAFIWNLESGIWHQFFVFCLLLSAFCLLTLPSTAGASQEAFWLPSRIVSFYTPIQEGLIDEKALEQWMEVRNLDEAQGIINQGLSKAQKDIDRINIRRLWARTLGEAKEPEKALAQYQGIKKAYPTKILGPGGMVLYSPAQISWEMARIQGEQGKGPEFMVQTAREILPANSDEAALVGEIKLFADNLRDAENGNALTLYQLLLQHAPNIKADVSWGDTVGTEAQAAMVYIKSDKSFAVKDKETLIKLLTEALQKKDCDALEKYACRGYFYTGIYGADVQHLSSFEAVKAKIRQSFSQGPAKVTRLTYAAPGKTFIHTNGWQGLESDTIVLMIVKTRYGWEWRGWMYY